jgi:hypothetical protein
MKQAKQVGALGMLLAATTIGCAGNQATISGTWRASSQGVLDDGACFYAGPYMDNDTVHVRVTRDGDTIEDKAVSCRKERFKVTVPPGSTNLTVTVDAVSLEGKKSGTVSRTVERVDGHVDLGMLKFRFGQ